MSSLLKARDHDVNDRFLQKVVFILLISQVQNKILTVQAEVPHISRYERQCRRLRRLQNGNNNRLRGELVVEFRESVAVELSKLK